MWDHNDNLGPFGEAAWGISEVGSGLGLELCTQLQGSLSSRKTCKTRVLLSFLKKNVLG